MTWNNNDPFEEMIEKLFRQFGIKDPSLIDDPNVKTWSYGYTLTQGPDGKPVIKEFGDNRFQKQNSMSDLEPEEQDILTQVDVDVANNRVRILAEIPGVTKEDIRINATEDNVTIRAVKDSQVITKELPLEVKIDPDTADASYNNGVLDLLLTLTEEKDRGKEIKIN
jgi:HSP20 family protein